MIAKGERAKKFHRPFLKRLNLVTRWNAPFNADETRGRKKAFGTLVSVYAD